MGKALPAQLTEVKVKFPFGLAEGTWVPDDSELQAAWSLYVELVTRVAVQSLDEGGLIREALSSLHQLFPETRTILRKAGPGVGATMPSVGGLAIGVLNRGLRPFLTKWHPELFHWESRIPEGTSPRDHESDFPRREELLRELNSLQDELEQYAVALGKIAGVRD